MITSNPPNKRSGRRNDQIPFPIKTGGGSGKKGADGADGGDSIPLLPPNHITDIHLAPTGSVTTLETVPTTAAAWAPGYLRNEGTTGNWIISIGGNTPTSISYSIKLGPGDSTIGTMGEAFKEAVLPVGTIKAFHDAPGGGGAGTLSGYIAWNDGTSPLAGPTGLQGLYGGGVTFDFKFSTTTADADPTAGYFRLSNATENTATQLFINLTSYDGVGLTNVFDNLITTLNPRLTFRIIKKSDVTKFLYMSVTAETTATGYRKFTISNIASSASSPFANNDECLILVGFPGNIAARGTTSLVTGTLGDTATETGTVILAKTFACAKVVASALCRIRLYSTSAARAADASRVATVQPTIGTQHGVILDLVLDTADKLTWVMSPLAYGANCESSPSTSISYSVQNLSGSSAAITITFTFTSEES